MIKVFLILWIGCLSLAGISASGHPLNGRFSANIFLQGHHNQIHQLVHYYGMPAPADEEEDLPFDNDTWFGYLMNWVMKILLWAIYLSLLGMVLAVTWWSLTAKGFWSWVVAMMGAFSYAMWLGRYWGYTGCLIAMVILFSIVKIFLSRRPEIVQPAKLSAKMKRSLRRNGNRS